VVQGVQLGHRATWFGGGRARPAPAPAPLPPPRTSGWRPAGEAVRLFGPYAVAADANTCPGSACYTVSSFELQEFSQPATVAKFCPISPLSQSFLGERLLGKGSELLFLCGILVRGNHVITSRCPQARQVACRSAAASPATGSRLVKCQRRFRH
jgi:hypothetical protein